MRGLDEAETSWKADSLSLDVACALDTKAACAYLLDCPGAKPSVVKGDRPHPHTTTTKNHHTHRHPPLHALTPLLLSHTLTHHTHSLHLYPQRAGARGGTHPLLLHRLLCILIS